MGYTMGCEKGPKRKKFAPIICVKCFNDDGEIVFNKLLEGNKGGMNIRFLMEWVKPNILGVMVNKKKHIS